MNASLRRLTALALVLTGATAAHPEDNAARTVLDEFAAALANLDSFRMESTVTYSGKYNESEESMDTLYEIDVNRGGDLALHVKNDNLDARFIAEKDRIVHFMPEFNQYMVRPRELSIAELMEQASFEIIDPVVTAFAALAQFKSPTEGYVLRDLALVGEEEINGVKCDRIHYSLGGTGYDLWIEQAPARTLRRIEPDMSALEQQYKDDYDMDFDITLSGVITSWEPNADISNAVAFAAPDGAEEVKRFGPKSEAQLMAGSPAPDFTLPLLGGGEFTLSEHKGKVVLLDFWATWCGPCRVAMPVLSAVSKEFADQGVMLVSVDLGEGPDEINPFLEAMNLDVTVALDQQGRVSEQYKVSGIPQTTIVGPDGIIHTVHVGLWAMPEMSPDDSESQQMEKMNTALTESLREELTAILKEFADK